MKIVEFHLEESKRNKGAMLLVATDEEGDRWVIGGNPQYATYVEMYELCWDAQEPEEKS